MVELLGALIVLFNFCIMLRNIFMKLHVIVWNTCGYVTCKITFYSVNVYTCY